MSERVWLVGAQGALRNHAQRVLADWECGVVSPFPSFDAADAPTLVILLLGDMASMSEIQAYLGWRDAFRHRALVLLDEQVGAEARAWLTDEEAHPRLPLLGVVDGGAGASALQSRLVALWGEAPSALRAEASAWRARFERQCGFGEVGDYFQILGLDVGAPAGALREAYARTRREFDPKSCKHALPADLEALRSVREVLDEAYAILRDPVRRERYRAALRGRVPEGDDVP